MVGICKLTLVWHLAGDLRAGVKIPRLPAAFDPGLLINLQKIDFQPGLKTSVLI